MVGGSAASLFSEIKLLILNVAKRHQHLELRTLPDGRRVIIKNWSVATSIVYNSHVVTPTLKIVNW